MYTVILLITFCLKTVKANNEVIADIFSAILGSSSQVCIHSTTCKYIQLNLILISFFFILISLFTGKIKLSDLFNWSCVRRYWISEACTY